MLKKLALAIMATVAFSIATPALASDYLANTNSGKFHFADCRTIKHPDAPQGDTQASRQVKYPKRLPRPPFVGGFSFLYPCFSAVFFRATTSLSISSFMAFVSFICLYQNREARFHQSCGHFQHVEISEKARQYWTDGLL